MTQPPSPENAQTPTSKRQPAEAQGFNALIADATALTGDGGSQTPADKTETAKPSKHAKLAIGVTLAVGICATGYAGYEINNNLRSQAEAEQALEKAQKAAAVKAQQQQPQPEVLPVTEPERPAGAIKRKPFIAVVADPQWIKDTAAATGVPERALQAYAAATLTVNKEQPACQMGWNTLAAVGAVETHHGTISGAAVNQKGQALPRIIGEPLTGEQFIAAKDSDGGLLDGNPEWDHAVGPLQFIPETWRQYARDADGDGWADIDSIDDQALSAATLLCEAGGTLTQAGNWITAIKAYNPSIDYNNDVAAVADQYAARVR